ncbi:MAG: peptidase S24 [Phycisphaerae bacterium]|nr:peptidase S24 [Phycisphaerae bacterium]
MQPGTRFFPTMEPRRACSRPLLASRVQAGFPSPADDYIDRALDLNEELIKHPAATFFVRATGDSMVPGGIHDGDLLVVDRSRAAEDGSVVIAVVDGELTLKRLKLNGDHPVLAPDNRGHAPIRITQEIEATIWGVVTWVIHQV